MPGDPPNTGSEVLSQSEVEALLSQVAQEQTTAAPPAPAMAAAAEAPAAAVREAKAYDFRGPSLLSATEARRARLKYDEFARSLGTRLSIYLRLEFNAQVRTLQTLAHTRFLEAVPTPSHLTLFRIEPLNGLGLLVAPLRLGFSIVDRMLGGAGDPGPADRVPSEVDVALLDVISHLVLKEWCQTVALAPEMQPQILTHETNPRFLPAASSETNVLHISLEVRLGDLAEPLQLAFPFGMVESLVRQLDAAGQARRAERPPARTAPLQWHRGLDDVPVPVTAGWDGLQITAQQLAHLKVGDVLPLEPQRFSRVQVRLARVPRFVGRLGAANRARAVELTETVPTEASALS